MNLPLEVATTLKSNELARLKCFDHCPNAQKCGGLEVSSLEKLKLLERTGEVLMRSELGHAASKYTSRRKAANTPPLLTRSV